MGAYGIWCCPSFLHIPPVLPPFPWHGQQAKFIQLANDFARLSNFTERLRSVDGATAVRKFNTYEEKHLIQGDEGHDVFVCLLHCNHRSMAYLVLLIGLNHLSEIYKLSLLLRQGAYFLRIVIAVRVIVHDPRMTTRLAQPGTDEQRELSREAMLVGGEGGGYGRN